MLYLARKTLLSLVASILCVGAASADATAADASAVDALIARLGAEKYAERERAERQIVAVGISARDALVKALNHADAEIALRARAALLAVIEADFQDRLARFAVEDDPHNDHGFAGWARFKRMFGSDDVARVLFVEMQRAEAVLLEVAEQNPDKIADAMIVRSGQLDGDRPRYGEYGEYSESDVPVASVAALLWLGGDAQLAVADRARAKVYSLLEDGFSYELRGGKNSALLKKLLGAWLTRSSGGPQAMQDMWMALRYQIPEGIKPALTILSGGGFEQPPRTREYALLVVAKFGDRSHLPRIEPLLSDSSSGDSPFRKRKGTEVRDVALATMIHLSGQKLKDFGFEKAGNRFFDELDIDSLGFSTNAKRQAALAKWRSWQKSQKAKK